jgi:hypothetical protein
MRSFVLDIIVIELCFSRGFPLEEEVNIAIINQGSLFGVILLLFWLYHCCSAISS